MADKTLFEIASIVEGRLIGDGSAVITGVASITDAGAGDISFISEKKYLKLLKTTKASAVIVNDESAAASGVAVIVAKNPQLAFAKLLDVFRPQVLPGPGVHPKAEAHKGALLGVDVSVQAFAVIEEGARVGDRTIIFPSVYIGRNASIGADCILYPGVVVREECKIGDRVIIHSNSIVGSDGFGYTRAGGKYVKLPQRGIVRICDDVEIGACVTIDRAAIGETVVGRGTKIDNLVQVAHNVKIGEDTIIVAQVGIAGSTTVGSRVQLGGQVGLAGHIEVGDDVLVGAQSGVTNDVPSKSIVSGYPVVPHGEWLRSAALFSKLPEFKKRIAELEKRLEELEKKG